MQQNVVIDLRIPACLGRQAVKHLPSAHRLHCSYAGAQTIAGAQNVAGREASPGLEDSSLQGSQADGEVLQHLRRLSKRDATTRLKALQVEKEACTWLCSVPEALQLYGLPVW